MTRKNNDVEVVEVELVHETDRAYLVRSCDTGMEAWVPKSRCELTDGELQAPGPLLVEKGLV